MITIGDKDLSSSPSSCVIEFSKAVKYQAFRLLIFSLMIVTTYVTTELQQQRDPKRSKRDIVWIH